jgi:hypothetical protein
LSQLFLKYPPVFGAPLNSINSIFCFFMYRSAAEGFFSMNLAISGAF